jgi:hypothetical protein
MYGSDAVISKRDQNKIDNKSPANYEYPSRKPN